MNNSLAVPGIRGGGEYGREWHLAGTGVNKQNSWDDFQAAARYLVQQRITCRNMLSVWGTSNGMFPLPHNKNLRSYNINFYYKIGGLLVSASTIQAPELFGCVIPDVGVHDLLRFHT